MGRLAPRGWLETVAAMAPKVLRARKALRVSVVRRVSRLVSPHHPPGAWPRTPLACIRHTGAGGDAPVGLGAPGCGAAVPWSGVLPGLRWARLAMP